MRIDIWSDLVCPWCFIGAARLDQALREHAAEQDAERAPTRPVPVSIVWHAFELDPSLPGYGDPHRHDETEAGYLVRTKGMPPADVGQMLRHVAETAAADGLVIDTDRVVPASSRLAHHLVQLAQSRGLADGPQGVVRALMTAHFTDGQDISDPAVLRRIGEAHGLPAADIEQALGSAASEDIVEADRQLAAQLGITSVPFAVVDGRYAVAGAQPVATFREALSRAAADDAASARSGGCGGDCGACGCGR